jgi:hypothetical protein
MKKQPMYRWYQYEQVQVCQYANVQVCAAYEQYEVCKVCTCWWALPRAWPLKPWTLKVGGINSK